MKTNLNNIWQKCSWRNLQQNCMEQMSDLFLEHRYWKFQNKIQFFQYNNATMKHRNSDSFRGCTRHVTCYEVRVRTGQQSMDDILSERRLHCLGHVIRMDHQRIPRQALHWEVPEFKRGPGRPRTNWRSTVNKDLLRVGIIWEEVEVAAENRSEWRRSVAQCTHLDAGWIRSRSRI